MKIADLYLKLGLDGAQDVGKGLTKVSNGFKDLISTSFLAKVSIAGAIYGLGRATIGAGKLGADLSNFSAAFGISLEKLQHLQGWGVKFGIEGDEVTNTLKKIQDAIAEAQAGRGYDPAFGLLGIDSNLLAKKGANAIEVFSAIQQRVKEISKTMGTQGFARTGAASLISSDLFGAMVRGSSSDKFRLPSGQILNARETANLDKANAEIQGLKQQIEMNMNKFISENAPLIVTILGEIRDGIVVITDVIKNSKWAKDIVSGKENVITSTGKAGVNSLAGAVEDIGKGLATQAGIIIRKAESGVEKSLGIPNAPKVPKSTVPYTVDESVNQTFIMNGVNIGEKMSSDLKKQLVDVVIQTSNGTK